ncbi:Rpn family recombination-promoting nuclease/putative transposase, partial [Priestia megaterium]
MKRNSELSVHIINHVNAVVKQFSCTILAAFLNAALRFPAEKKIYKVQLLDPHFNKENQEDQRSILDVHAQLEDGSRVNIEIQLNNKHDMEKRTLYY